MPTFNVNVPSQIDDNLTASTTQGASKTAINTALGLKANKVAISGATKTKITYNAEGIVTGGADATTADIADSLNKRYQTDNQQSFNDATSSIQTQLNTKVVTVDLFNVNNLSVVDLVQYFIGQSTTAGTTVNQIPLVPVQAGTVVAVTAEVFSASTIGSNENGTLTLWYNNGAASVVISAAFKVDANRHAFTEYTGLSTAINSGNIYMTYDAPSLATNPTGIQFRFNVYIRP